MLFFTAQLQRNSFVFYSMSVLLVHLTNQPTTSDREKTSSVVDTDLSCHAFQIGEPIGGSFERERVCANGLL